MKTIRQLEGFDPEVDRPVFMYLNAIDVAKIIGRQYAGVQRNNRLMYPKFVASFLYLITFIDGWSNEYTNKYLASATSLKYRSEVPRYRKRHWDFWNAKDSARYRMRIQLALEAMRKKDYGKSIRYATQDVEPQNSL